MNTFLEQNDRQAETARREREAVAFLSERKGAITRVFAGTAKPDDVVVFFRYLNQICCGTTSTYLPGMTAEDHAFNAGKREVLLLLLEHVHTDPEILFERYR